MWLISLTILTAVVTIILYKIMDIFDIAFVLASITVVSFFCITTMINDTRIANKFNEEKAMLIRNDFEPVFYKRDYCHITHLNYIDEHQMVIEKFRFKEMREYKWSKQTYYRIDVNGCDLVPLKSFWINDQHLTITVIDGVLPCFKQVEKFIEVETPLFYKLFLPPSYNVYKPKRIMGNLYVPAEPIIQDSQIPDNVQYDLLDRMEKASSL